MKTKIFIFICAFALLISILVVPSFALDNDFTGDYEFSHYVYFSPLNMNGTYLDFMVAFSCQGVQYEMMSFVYNLDADSHSMHYWTDTDSIMVYNSSSGWLSDEYRYIYISSFDTQSSHTLNFASFLLANEYVPEPNYNGWYYDIYDLLAGAIFDYDIQNGYQEVSLSLVATIICVLTVCMPLIVILYVGKHLLSLRWW